MPGDHPHLSEEDLILAMDGELPPGHAQWVRAHLAHCASCRDRLAGTEELATDFAQAHRASLDPVLPSAEGPRALLRARMAQLQPAPGRGAWRLLAARLPQLGWSAAAAVLLVGIAAGILARRPAPAPADAFRANVQASDAAPDRALTPGATRPVSISEVCAMPHEEVVKEVSASLRTEVFEEYGIRGARAGDYEIDYLITPGLGGTDDIQNLWPEPYHAGAWDAHAKDALEERLHQLVCARKLDLLTAQRAISTDWISAYKKYFDTDRPQYVAGLADAPASERKADPQRVLRNQADLTAILAFF